MTPASGRRVRPRGWRRLASSERGAAMAEYAAVVPVLVAVALCLLQLGLTVVERGKAEQAARAVAEAAATLPAGPVSPADAAGLVAAYRMGAPAPAREYRLFVRVVGGDGATALVAEDGGLVASLPPLPVGGVGVGPGERAAVVDVVRRHATFAGVIPAIESRIRKAVRSR